MNAYYHSQSSSHKWGGGWKAYKEIHDFLDHTKAHVAELKHRAILHNSWGIYIVEAVFGELLDVPGQHGVRHIPTRLIAERHVIEDLGKIPSLQDCIGTLKTPDWMAGKFKALGNQNAKQVIPLPTLEEAMDRLKGLQ